MQQRRTSKPTPKSSQFKRMQKPRMQGGLHTLAADGTPNGFHPPTDGVFRAIPNVVPQPNGKIFSQHGVWTATIEIVGEMYQAYFDSQEDALEAFNAAGYG
ncbi:unnamed protein product [Ostreobium quekettii]|uniref:Uncharacterized protein n=1 Tax=Ostreobium quekettii TaxID=121088 RepID=A0A8S1JE82_9CHLO|nr:unnamed protein product [Ostreobium quekettii]|eukprot:evm.model.scf_1833EXC.3 EVM.evm.TU.scf_1833EXC.3   scf_1833EXC:24441-26511(+)